MIYIGEAAKMTGASVKAIRHYDELGLLPGVTRSGSYRVFADADINLIKLIKQAQSLGFKLSEFNQAISSQPEVPSWVQIEKLLHRKQTDIAEKIAALEEKQKRLQVYRKEIRDCLKDNADCSSPLL
ncbi:MAG: MerR family transcriptional regulator [Pseudomonadales bacterium]|nr:MerR family transcriptional regulator [Pseudomonadales bacterium]